MNPASFGIPVNTREPEEPPGFRARLVVEDFPAPPGETDVQVGDCGLSEAEVAVIVAIRDE